MRPAVWVRVLIALSLWAGSCSGRRRRRAGILRSCRRTPAPGRTSPAGVGVLRSSSDVRDGSSAALSPRYPAVSEKRQRRPARAAAALDRFPGPARLRRLARREPQLRRRTRSRSTSPAGVGVLRSSGDVPRRHGGAETLHRDTQPSREKRQRRPVPGRHCPGRGVLWAGSSPACSRRDPQVRVVARLRPGRTSPAGVGVLRSSGDVPRRHGGAETLHRDTQPSREKRQRRPVTRPLRPWTRSSPCAVAWEAASEGGLGGRPPAVPPARSIRLRRSTESRLRPSGRRTETRPRSRASAASE